MIECSGNSILVLLSCTYYNGALVSCPDLGPSPCKGTIKPRSGNFVVVTNLCMLLC